MQSKSWDRPSAIPLDQLDVKMPEDRDTATDLTPSFERLRYELSMRAKRQVVRPLSI